MRTDDTIKARLMSARDLDRLGLPLRRYLDGAVGLEAVVRGRGLDFSSIDMALDLEQAAVAALREGVDEPSADEPGGAGDKNGPGCVVG